VAAAVDPDADHEALRHWILAVNEREQLSELATAQPLIPGTRHTNERPHLVLNPLFRRIRELTADIEKAQEAFGMTPLSLFRLQLTYADAGQSLAALRRQDASEQKARPVVDLDAI
jgi:hypothetical protein